MDAKNNCSTFGQLNYSLSFRSEIFNFIGRRFSSRLIYTSWLKKIWILPAEELADIPTVCGSLREAIECLEADQEYLLAGDVFTKDQIEGYIELKMEEIETYEHTPHPVEYGMYYSC